MNPCVDIINFWTILRPLINSGSPLSKMDRFLVYKRVLDHLDH
jgi:hypothetical protein